MSVVFYAFGVAAIALACPAADRHRLARPHPVVPALLALAGLGLIAAGVFEVDRPLAPETMEEMIHSNAAVGAFVMLIVVDAAVRRRDPRATTAGGRSGGWRAGLAGLAALAAVGTQFAGDGFGSGAVQRVLAGAVLAWFLLTATPRPQEGVRAVMSSESDTPTVARPWWRSRAAQVVAVARRRRADLRVLLPEGRRLRRGVGDDHRDDR